MSRLISIGEHPRTTLTGNSAGQYILKQFLKSTVTLVRGQSCWVYSRRLEVAFAW